MRENYPTALAAVLRYEGGYSNHPADPGGATMKGVTQATYDAWRSKHGLSHQSVRSISQDEIEQIYRRDYWDRIHGDTLPSGLDLCVFDFAVNSGPSRAIRALQKVLGVRVDGVIGPQTLAAANAHPKSCGELCDTRLSFMRGLKTWPVFGKGWGDRVADVKKKGLTLAAKAPVVVAKAVPHGEEKSIFDEIGDFIDWTKGQKDAPQAAPSHDDALHTYLVPAMIAFFGALAGADWNSVMDNPSASIVMVLTGALAAAYKAAAPWWAKALWKGPRAA
jgi:lysozyme family protein